MMLPGPTDPRYRSYYRRIARDKIHYVIMDNGAWETKSLAAGDLIGLAWRFNVQEIVAPDVINNPKATLTAMRKFFRVYKDFHLVAPNWNPAFMAVAHGKTITQAQDFIKAVVDTFPDITVMAAGRAFTRNVEDPHARASLAFWAAEYLPDRFKFHLLGHNDAWPGELAACRDVVRSTDTAAPFKAAYHKVDLATLTEHSIPRPDNYFGLPAEEFDITLLEANIEYLRTVA